MKSFLKSLVAMLLAALARGIIRKYRPIVVMVTGSVGKTSTKDAIAAALSERYYLRASEKSYNSEFGVPLTIIGAKNPWEDPTKWGAVLLEAVALILFPSHYPKLLVLEVGADRPGDLAKILGIAAPDAVVVTRLPDVPVHVEAYPTPASVRDEEFRPAYGLPDGAPLIISADDPHASRMAARLGAHVVTYGFSKEADVRIEDPRFVAFGEDAGMHATLSLAGHPFPIVAPATIGRSPLYAPAAALALATALGLAREDARTGLARYAPPPGRARILPGREGSLLIDDSYNASPAAAEEALDALALMPEALRRIAVMGDMLELGRYSVEEHHRIGRLAAEEADILVTVGARARGMADAARAAGMKDEHVFSFDASREAAERLQDMVREGDLVLIKGSQSIRTERITEALLRDPADASKLARQDREWKRR